MRIAYPLALVATTLIGVAACADGQEAASATSTSRQTTTSSAPLKGELTYVGWGKEVLPMDEDDNVIRDGDALECANGQGIDLVFDGVVAAAGGQIEIVTFRDDSINVSFEPKEARARVMIINGTEVGRIPTVEESPDFVFVLPGRWRAGILQSVEVCGPLW